jgi:hypothetical protein
MPFEGGLDQQPGLGFAARTAIGFIMGANEEIIERQGAAQQIVHPFQLATGLIPARQARLVGGGNEHETPGLEFAQQWCHHLVDMEFLQRQGADLVLAFHSNPNQYSVPFNKYTLLHASAKA